MEIVEHKGKIFEAMTNIMAKIGVIGKDSTAKATGFTYNFRGIDDVMNALHPALVENHVFILPETLEHQSQEVAVGKDKTPMIKTLVKMKYTFFASDGSYVSAIMNGEGLDMGDKSTSKATSTALKYACIQIFCIPTKDMPDSDMDLYNKDTGSAGHASVQAATPNKLNLDAMSRNDMLVFFQKEIVRTGKSLKFFLEQTGASSINFIKNEKLKEFITILVSCPDRTREQEGQGNA